MTKHKCAQLYIWRISKCAKETIYGGILCTIIASFRFVFMFNVLGTNRQSSVPANSIRQNAAPMRKTAPNETTTCIWFTPSKKFDTEEVC